MKRYYDNEYLSKEEKHIIEQYITIHTIEEKIRALFLKVEEKGLSSINDLIREVNQSGYDIRPLLQKKLESGIYNPWYYLLDAYFNEKYRKERVKKIVELLKSSDNEEGIYNLGVWLGENAEKDYKKEMLYTLFINELFDNYKYIFEVGNLVGRGIISQESFEKIVYMFEAYKNFLYNKT